MGQPRHHRKERARRPPKFLGPPTYAKTVWSRATKFGVLTHVGKSAILGLSHAPNHKGRGTSVTKIEITYMRAHSMSYNKEILHGDQTRCEENFTGTTTNADLFAVANLLV